MRELDFLHYQPGQSWWHRHDPRMKLLELVAWSALALAGSWQVTLSIVGITLAIHIISRSALRRLLRPLLFWLAMISVFILTSGTADDSVPLTFLGHTTPLGLEGSTDGAIRGIRLLAVLLAGQLLAATTDPSDLAGALRILSSWLPQSWSAAIANGISLTVSFIPLMMDDAATIRDAAISRGLASRRGLMRRAVSLALPMAEATLRRADLTTEALVSRSLVTDPTVPVLRLRIADWLTSLAVVLPPALLTVLLPL